MPSNENDLVKRIYAAQTGGPENLVKFWRGLANNEFWYIEIGHLENLMEVAVDHIEDLLKKKMRAENDLYSLQYPSRQGYPWD